MKNKINCLSDNVYKIIQDILVHIKAKKTIDQIISGCQNLVTLLDNLEDAFKSFAKLNTLHSSLVSITNFKKKYLLYLITYMDQIKLLN